MLHPSFRGAALKPIPVILRCPPKGGPRRTTATDPRLDPGRRPSRLAALAPQGDGDRVSKRHHSRESQGPPSFAISPLTKRGKRSADRRSGASAPVCERASYVGPRVPAQGGFHRLRAGGRSPLGAPPRRFIGAEPAWAYLRALHMSGALRCCIAAFTGPARSSGRAVSLGRLPGVSCACTDSRDAASRPA
jgi:hypothetical protein